MYLSGAAALFSSFQNFLNKENNFVQYCTDNFVGIIIASASADASADLSADMPENRLIKLNIIVKHSRML